MDDAGISVFEGIRSVSAVISGNESGTSDRRVIEVLYDGAKEKQRFKELAFLRRKGEAMGFAVSKVSAEELCEITSGNTHGGIAARCTGRTIADLADSEISVGGFYVMLEGIEDPYNFGYALRTIYAAGADGVVLSPRNWMSAAGTVCRSSAGASELLPMCIAEPDVAADYFHDRGYKIVAAGIRDSVSAFDADLRKPIMLIVGGEKRGISRALIDCADTVVRLDYGREFQGSLSAASAASVLAYEVLRQNRNT